MKAVMVILCCVLCIAGAWSFADVSEQQFTAQEETATQTTPSTTTATTTITTTATKPTVAYALTDEERDIVERVVMAEAGAEPFVGQIAVAQCILNAARIENIRPDEVVKMYKYTPDRPDPTDEVREAVSAVFDKGWHIFGADVLYFYAPAWCDSEWHESKVHVATIGGHKFFKEAG